MVIHNRHPAHLKYPKANQRPNLIKNFLDVQIIKMHVSGSAENFKYFFALVLKLLMKNMSNLFVRLFVISLLTFRYPSPRWGLDSDTSCWGGGGPKGPPRRSPKLLDRFPNFKRHSIALYVNYPYKVKHLTRRSLMTSQVRLKSEFSTFRAW